MRRTSVLVEEETYDALRRIAEERGENLSEVLRAALVAYVHRSAASARPFTFVGAGRSGRTDIAGRIDEVLDDSIGRGERGWR